MMAMKFSVIDLFLTNFKSPISTFDETWRFKVDIR